jgi:serine/threonine protein kinase
MAILPGRRLGPYEILSAIGAGGMGEVYQAHDTKLERDVAVKVLPEAFAHDPERLSRFQHEAKILAQLNHSNIATIYGLEHSNDTHYLVMELVPGDTLAHASSEMPRFQSKKRWPSRSRSLKHWKLLTRKESFIAI